MGEINCENLKEAFAKTCGYRKTNFFKEDVNTLLKELETDIQALNRWNLIEKYSCFVHIVDEFFFIFCVQDV